MTSAGSSERPDAFSSVARQIEQVAHRPGEHDDHRDRKADEEDAILAPDQIHTGSAEL